MLRSQRAWGLIILQPFNKIIASYWSAGAPHPFWWCLWLLVASETTDCDYWLLTPATVSACVRTSPASAPARLHCQGGGRSWRAEPPGPGRAEPSGRPGGSRPGAGRGWSPGPGGLCGGGGAGGEGRGSRPAGRCWWPPGTRGRGSACWRTSWSGPSASVVGRVYGEKSCD